MDDVSVWIAVNDRDGLSQIRKFERDHKCGRGFARSTFRDRNRDDWHAAPIGSSGIAMANQLTNSLSRQIARQMRYLGDIWWISETMAILGPISALAVNGASFRSRHSPN